MTKHLIYLASGNSNRFGENKLLVTANGKPLYLHGLEQLIKAAEGDPACVVTVVSRYPEIRSTARQMGLRAVDCPESRNGLSYSIKAGIHGAGPCSGDDFLMFICADQPNLTAASIRKLLDHASPGVETARLFWGDSPGNPVLFSAALIPELMQLQGDQGGAAVVKNHRCLPVQADHCGELEDIDFREDLLTVRAP